MQWVQKLSMITSNVNHNKECLRVKSIFRIIAINFYLSTFVYAEFVGVAWRDLKPKDVEKRTDGTGQIVTGREIVLEDESVLNLSTIQNPVLEEQYYGGDLKFESFKTLTLNINTSKSQIGEMTPIYWRKRGESRVINSFSCGTYQDSVGSCAMYMNVDSVRTPSKQLINMEASTILFSPSFFVYFLNNSQVSSVFSVGVKDSKSMEGTLEFFAGLNVDLRKTIGVFTDPRIGDEKRKLIFENYGAAINVNPDKRPFSIRLYGDIYSEGLGTRINLVTADSVFEGHYDIGNSPSIGAVNALTLQNGARANIALSYLTPNNENTQNFELTLNDSSAKLDIVLGQTKNAVTNFSINNSTLYANFTYTSQTRGAKDQVRIDFDRGVWITNKSAYADQINFKNQGIIDLRYSDFEGNFRSYPNMDENNRLVLTSESISGSGTFKLYGILNRTLWGEDVKGNSIATDQIITKELVGNHYVQIYWDANTLDENLLSDELVGYRIVVAKQLSKSEEGDFIGASAPVGLFEYTTNLTKEELYDDSGAHIGYEWVIGKFEKGGLAPTAQPSLLSKTLNSSLNIPYKTWLAQTQTLHERMGELRNQNNIFGAYVKTSYSLFYSQKNQKEISSLTNTFEVTLGGDYSFYTYGGKSFLGLALNIIPIWDLGEDNAYNGESISYGFSAYETFLFDNGLYMDFLFKYIYASHHYKYSSFDLNSNTLNFNTHALLGSYEMGYMMKLPINAYYGFYYLTPQFNLNFGYLSGGKNLDFVHTSGYDIDAKIIGAFPLQTTLSVGFGRRFENENLYADVFANLGGEYTFNAGNALKLHTPLNHAEFLPENIFNLKMTLGANVVLSQARFYFEVSSKFIGRIAPVLSLSAGARIPLGEQYPRLSNPKIHFPLAHGSSKKITPLQI